MAVPCQAVSYVGERADINYQSDAQDFAGPLDSQVMGALRFVQRNMRVAAVKTIGRGDLPQFSLRAVFEALVNAVAHRDYSVHGARIRLTCSATVSSYTFPELSQIHSHQTVCICVNTVGTNWFPC